MPDLFCPQPAVLLDALEVVALGERHTEHRCDCTGEDVAKEDKTIDHSAIPLLAESEPPDIAWKDDEDGAQREDAVVVVHCAEMFTARHTVQKVASVIGASPTVARASSPSRA